MEKERKERGQLYKEKWMNGQTSEEVYDNKGSEITN